MEDLISLRKKVEPKWCHKGVCSADKKMDPLRSRFGSSFFLSDNYQILKNRWSVLLSVTKAGRSLCEEWSKSHNVTFFII